MTLRLDPHDRNTYPLGGVLIRGTSPSGWVAELQRMGLSLNDSVVYALPGNVPNSVWGCLAVLPGGTTPTEPGPNMHCQVAEGVLFLPERARLWPALSDGELTDLLRGIPHLLHPDIGFVELTDRVDWPALLILPTEQPTGVRRPEMGVAVPEQVRTFRVVPMAPADALAALMQDVGEPSVQPIHKPLSWLERLKLWLLRLLFRHVREEEAGEGKPTKKPRPAARPTGLSAQLQRLFSSKKPLFNRLQHDFEQLAERNQRQVDQLLNLLRDNPALALKYAIPLDTDGTARGGGGADGAAFNWTVRWPSFSLFDSGTAPGRGRGGAATLEDDQFARLREQYNQTARTLEAQQDYRKAAFVYLKLLKEPLRAAQTLEAGKLYQEAAALYLKPLNDKQKAAACYEKGAMLPEAITLYNDLSDHEKVGDLYCLLNRRPEALPHYQRVVDTYAAKGQFVRAALVYRQKMGNPLGAQTLLLNGWRNGSDAFNCLNNYFVDIPDEADREAAIEAIYRDEVAEANGAVFLDVLRYEFDKQPGFSDRLRDIAYELVAAQLTTQPNVLAQLKAFAPDNQLITKDIARYRARR
jgi:tetratricopeptide (TPR) repeat protein